MLSMHFSPLKSILCLGAHADDIEIGCGGTLLKLIAEHPHAHLHWVVFSGSAERAAEARTSAELFLERAGRSTVTVHNFRDSFFPYQGELIKEEFARLQKLVEPDLIFTHRRDDAHQDHRVLAELTWCAFRNHQILEYEIPKYEGDLGRPNFFVPLEAQQAEAKVRHLTTAFASQHAKPWFSAETFFALMRLRGVECNAPGKLAEGFYCRKLCV